MRVSVLGGAEFMGVRMGVKAIVRVWDWGSCSRHFWIGGMGLEVFKDKSWKRVGQCQGKLKESESAIAAGIIERYHTVLL